MKNALKSYHLLISKYPYDILIQLLSIAVATITTLIPIRIIDRLVVIFESQGSDENRFKEAIIVIVVMGLIYVACNFLDIIIAYYNSYVERNFKADLSIMFFQKLDSIDYDFHENPKFLNDYTRALEDGTQYIYQSAMGINNVARIIVQSVSVFIVIFTMHYLAVVYAVLIGAIYMILRIKIGKMNHETLNRQRPFYRERGYINRTFFIKDAMADLKTTQIEGILLENNLKASDEIIAVIDDITKKKTILHYIGDLLITSIYPITLGVLAFVTIENFSNAAFASLTVAATTLSTLVSSFVSSIGDLQNSAVECKIPYEVLQMESKIEGLPFTPLATPFQHLEVKGATFSYDGRHPVLKNIHMEIKKGEKIAIVGSNGAGKTTLVKLLLRLYDVEEGTILINGQDYKETNATSLRKQVGAVFQNVEVYAVSIAENVIFRKPETDEDIDLVRRALAFSGLDTYVNQLPEGINTQVTREFNKTGAIFSGGQMQRLAIARGYAQNYNLFILDEPSSALDPLAEAQVYQNMLALGRDRTIVFISHRLTTTVNADHIYLFEEGEIIEHGRHDELLALNGKYKEMFISQASKYLGENHEDR
ncbi:MAG: ABC transporter ATP-binding protein [Bacilli bacterium]|nr:ABC transporter ATP-binding protein [Bacilli bacterium]